MPRVSGKNPHELMHAMELRNIMLTMEMHFLTAIERKESREGGFRQFLKRTDYPEENPQFNEPLIIRHVNGKMKIAPASKMGG